MRRFHRWHPVELIGALLIALGYLFASIMPLSLALVVMGIGFLVVVVGVVGRHVWRSDEDNDGGLG